MPGDFDIERALADVAWLVDEVGPRPSGSAAERVAAEGVADRLRAAGWTPAEVGLLGNQVACRGAGGRLFMAHIDTVKRSPGAIDNAAGVAILLELARTTRATDLCLGFPVGEEIGLQGSAAMARRAWTDPSWHPTERPLQLVVSLDLVGHGDLSAMGFGPSWTPDRLAWLTAHMDPVPDIPYAYQVYSRLAPSMERSDHAPFSHRGAAGLLLLGRGPGGVFSRYHQTTDTTVEPQALVDTARALEQLATAPLPPTHPIPAPWTDDPGTTGAAAVLFGHTLPSPVTWGLIVLGIGSGLADWRRATGVLRHGIIATLAALAGGLLTSGLAVAGLWAPTEAELTAAATFRAITATGWWDAAPFALGAGLLAFCGVRAAIKNESSAAFACAIMTIGGLFLEPLLALPFAVAAIAARIHPLLALGPALYLLRPDGLRQLTFHGLLPPLAWGALWLLAWPAVARYPRSPLYKLRRRRSHAPSSP